MITVKQQSLDAISYLPDTATIEEIMEVLFVRKQIIEGRRDVEEGRVVSHDEAKRRFHDWSFA